MEVIVHGNREVCPNRLFVGNQYENKIEKVKFSFPDYEGYHYLIINKSGESYAVPLLNDVFYVDSLLTFKSGIYESHAVISGKKLEQTTEIDGSVLTFISNPISLIVKRNKINAGSLSEAPLPQNLQIVYDQLFNTYEQIKSDYDSGAFNGKDGYSPTLDVTPIENGNHITINDINGEKEIDVTNGIDGKSAYDLAVKNGFEGTEQEWLESLRYDHSDEFKKLADQVKLDAKSAEDSATKAESAMNEANIIAQANVEAINKASTDAQNAITTSKDSAVKAVQDAQSTAEEAISDKQAKAVQAVETVKTSATQEITEQKESAVSAITQERSEAIEAIETGKTEAVEAITTAKDEAIEEIENTGVPLEDIEKLAIKETTQGNPTIISDSAEWTLQKLNVYGQSEQDSTTGKNLLAYPYISSDKTQSGVTFTVNSDGSISVSGTATQEVYFNLINMDLGEEHFGINSNKEQQAKNGYTLSANCKKTNMIVSYSGDAKLIYTYALAGATVKGTLRVQIEKGDVATPWEKYTGGKPSPSPDYPQEIISKEVSEIKVTGANLLNPTGAFKQGWNINLPNVKFEVGNTYTFTPPKMAVGKTCGLFAVASNTELVSYINNGTTRSFTVKENADFSQGVILAGGSETAMVDVDEKTAMVELGSVATEFEPYKSQTITLAEPITLRGVFISSGGNVIIDGKWYIGDVICDKDGVVGIERNIAHYEITGNENVRKFADGIFFYISDLPRKSLSSDNGLCTHCKYLYIGGGNDKVGICVAQQSATCRFNLELETVEEYKAVFKQAYDEGNPFKVYYHAEPTFEPLPEEIQSQYKALKSYYPNTVIQTGCWNEVEYVADTKTWIKNKINGVTELALGIGGK